MPAHDIAKAKGNSSVRATLLESVRALDGPMLLERSAKLIDGNLREGRFLVSVPKSALYPGPDRQLRRVCCDLGAPSDGYEILSPHLPAATNVHFGYEPEDSGALFKCYLEFPSDDSPHTGLVFLALKWVTAEDDAVANFTVAQYWSRREMPHAAKKNIADTVIPAGPARRAAHQMLDIARNADAGRAATLLEVEEPGTPRRSIDINLADAEMTLDDLRAQLDPVFDDAAARRLFDDLLAREGTATLGHFAAGRARDGSAFTTLYYGADFV